MCNLEIPQPQISSDGVHECECHDRVSPLIAKTPIVLSESQE